MRRLCLFSGGFAAAAAGYLWLLDGAPWVVIAAAAALCALLFALRTNLTRRAAICLLGVAIGLCWCRGYETLRLQPLERYDGRTLPIAAQAQDSAQKTAYGFSVDARVQFGGRSYPAVLYFDEPDGEITPGDWLQCEAKLTDARQKLERGNVYDSSRGVLLSAGCRGALHVSPGSVPVALWPALLAERLRAAISAAFPADTAGFLQALLLGDKTALSYAERNELSIAGIYHAVAVSGMHVSILLGMVLLLCGGNHRLAAALGIPVIVFFILMTGAPASAVRAGVMQTLLLCAPLGLQLSFASTAGIILFAGGVYRSLTCRRTLQKLLQRHTPPAWLLRAMLAAFSCTVASMVFALPVTAAQFGELSLAAPVVNVLCLWMLSVVFCGGMLTGLLALAWPVGAAIPAWVLSWPVRLVQGIVHAAARVPFAALYLDNGYLITAAVFLYGLALLLALRPGWVRPWQAALAAVVVTGCCMGLSCLDYRLPESSFTMLDVGQGQCLVYRAGDSVSVIDCGGQEDVSGETAARYLLARGVRQIDRLILTHDDADHCNGVRQLLRRVRVGTILLPAGMQTSAVRAQLLLAAAQAGVPVREVARDLPLPVPGGMLTVFAPVGDAEADNNGLCVLAACGKCDILVTGDLPEQAEYRLLSTHELPHVTALVAGHHGAKTSTSQTLLRAVQPQAVLISAGADNRFGHPAAGTLARIRRAGAAVYRTDVSGTITIRG